MPTRLCNPGILFQSLSGFLVRCNYGSQFEAGMSLIVSIPVGFSRSLQHKEIAATQKAFLGFNPCRVFSFAATLQADSPRNPPPRFQSLSGFLVRCNGSSRPRTENHMPCFNPCRVFSFAATCRCRKP